MKPLLREKGTVLILALWSLALLTVFAIAMGVHIQQKIKLVSRLEKRAQFSSIAEAGIRKSVGLLKKEFEQDKTIRKTALFDNLTLFKKVAVGPFFYDVAYKAYDGLPDTMVYGVVDEERKININTADRTTLESLFRQVTDLTHDGPKDLANAIVDWREYGEGQVGGFFSEEYYDKLKFPYKEKKGNFETIDELSLVEGMTPQIYQQVFPYVTIYGDGKININSAPKAVLVALGMDGGLANRIVLARWGLDGKEGTSDDIVLSADSDFVQALSGALAMTPEEREEISQLFSRGKIGSQSSFFMVKSRGYSSRGKESRVITCVFDLNSDKIRYWREE